MLLQSQTPGNSPMDVDSVESDDNAAKHGHSKEGEEKMQTGAGHDKPDLLSSLPPPSHTGADVRMPKILSSSNLLLVNMHM